MAHSQSSSSTKELIALYLQSVEQIAELQVLQGNIVRDIASKNLFRSNGGEVKPGREYKDIGLSEFALLAEKSSSELGAMGGVVVDYETGSRIAFTDEDTAMFIASARSIVLELVRRIRELQKLDSSSV